MIENWIDPLCDVWGTISDERFGNVRSYQLVNGADFPASIDAAELDMHPIAITLPAYLMVEYGTGSPRIGYWTGVTQFHVCSDLSMARMPQLMRWFGKIASAAALNMTLGGRVVYFAIDDREDAITGPIELRYGAESPHWGFLARWKVKEALNGFTVSA